MAIRIERDRYTGVAQAFADYLGMNSCLEPPRIMSVAKFVKSHTVKIDSSYDRGEGVHYFPGSSGLHLRTLLACVSS